MNRIEYYKEKVKGKKVLDLGCLGDYNNELSVELSKHCDYTGVDICKARLKDNPQAIYGDIQNLPKLGEFDVILALEIVEHVSDLDGLFKSISGNLKRKGEVYFCFDNPWAINSVIRGWFFKKTGYVDGTVCASNHFFWMCPTTFENICKKHGFKVVYHRYYTESNKYLLLCAFNDIFIPKWHQSIMFKIEPISEMQI